MRSAVNSRERETEFSFTKADFDTVVDLVYRRSGIVLGANKMSMVYARLARRLRELGLTRFADYCALLQSEAGSEEVVAFTNAMTTNLTRFFREPHHFEHLASVVIPEILNKKAGRRLRIWSAGCSTGEEPYSIAMTLAQAIPDLSAWDVRILATDLDTNVLETGAKGQYASEALDSIPAPLRRTAFDVFGGRATIAPALRRLVAFKPLNLMHAWPMHGPFDAIFCRNVMIYFDASTKAALVERFAGLLRTEAMLYVGHAETLLNLQNQFRLEGRTAYRRV